MGLFLSKGSILAWRVLDTGHTVFIATLARTAARSGGVRHQQVVSEGSLVEIS